MIRLLTSYAPWLRDLPPLGWGVVGFVCGGVLAWVFWGVV